MKDKIIKKQIVALIGCKGNEKLPYKELLKLSKEYDPKKKFKHVDLGNGFTKVVEIKDPD